MNISIKGSLRGLTGTAAVLAAALGLNMVGPHRAYAAPRPLAAPSAGELGVTILSPDPHVPLAGLKPVEISAFYQGSPANQIVAIELFIDGARAASKTLEAPETRGVVSFLVDAGQISAGSHQIVVRATAADQEVESAKSQFTFNGMDGTAIPLSNPANSNLSGPNLSKPTDPALSSGLPPTLRLISPTRDGRVQGVITLRVEATDPSGKAPYVSLFIDKTFKTLRNYAPYEFDWDTTAYSNGYHTIEAYGYNDSSSIGHAKTLRLYVNNPGGDTGIRHDLLDTVPPVKPPRLTVAAKHMTAAAKKQSEQPRIAEKALPAARLAFLPPAHTQSTAEIVRQLASGASSLRFGSLDFATELSTPFAADKATAAEKTQATPAKMARLRSFKPIPSALAKTPAANTEFNTSDLKMPSSDAVVETPTRRQTKQIAAHPQIASIRLPASDLASPFVAVPQVKALAAARTKIAIHTALKTPMKTHAVHVHLPLGMNSLLRSVGEKTLLFNHTTVTMDRPLTAQNRVLFGPLRQVFEQGGGTLLWQPRTATVRAKSATQDILLTIGDNHAQVNAKSVTLDGKPYLLMGRTMVPLSFIALALDSTVQFDPATGHLMVTSRK